MPDSASFERAVTCVVRPLLHRSRLQHPRPPRGVQRRSAGRHVVTLAARSFDRCPAHVAAAQAVEAARRVGLATRGVTCRYPLDSSVVAAAARAPRRDVCRAFLVWVGGHAWTSCRTRGAARRPDRVEPRLSWWARRPAKRGRGGVGERRRSPRGTRRIREPLPVALARSAGGNPLSHDVRSSSGIGTPRSPGSTSEPCPPGRSR